MTSGNRTKVGLGTWMTTLIDTATKLVPAAAVVVAAIIANRFQAANTAAHLLNQREQSDSSLRAGMLSDLINPITAGNDLGKMPLDQEQLLVELLALNFNEHFELKPLMLHVDGRLAREGPAPTDRREIARTRNSLRSVANRVTQRQLAQLTRAGESVPVEQQSCIYSYRLKVAPRERSASADVGSPIEPCSEQPVERFFGDLITLPSPGGTYTLAFTIRAPDHWQDETFKVLMSISNAADTGTKPQTKIVSAEQDFTLTWFDFPFTDNTLLADGTRFSLVIDRVKAEIGEARFKLIWFPRDYFSPRERPTNHLRQREKLGLLSR